MEVNPDIRTFLKRGHDLGMGALASLTTAHCMIWLYGCFWVSSLVDFHHMLFVFSAFFHPCAIVAEITYLSLAMRWRQAGEYQRACGLCVVCTIIMACLGIMGLAFIVALNPHRGASDAERFLLCELWAFQTIAATLFGFVVACFAISDHIMIKFGEEKKKEEEGKAKEE